MMREPGQEPRRSRGGASNIGAPPRLLTSDGRPVYVQWGSIGEQRRTGAGLVYGGVIVLPPGRIGKWYVKAYNWCLKIREQLEYFEPVADPVEDIPEKGLEVLINSLKAEPFKTTNWVHLLYFLMLKVVYGTFLTLVFIFKNGRFPG
jgi:hypothetical protein